MTHRTMRRLALLLFGLAATALWAPRASAQLSNVTIVRVEGEGVDVDKKNATPIYVNAEECASDFEFQLANLQQTVPVLEAWATTSTTAKCTASASRSTANDTTPPCWLAGSVSGASGEYKFKIPGSKLFDKDGTCPTEAFAQVVTVYFVPLPSPSDSTGSTATDALTTVIQPWAKFTLYTKRPTPPTGVKVHPGEGALRVTWDRVDSNPLTKYRVFFDYGTGGVIAPDCGSDALEPQGAAPAPAIDAGTADASSEDTGTTDATDADAGATDEDAGSGAASASTTQVDPPAEGTPFVKTVDDKGEEASLSALDDIPIGSNVRVAVATIDATGNVGYLSPRQCVQRIETMTFLEACNADPDCRGQLETCNLAPGRTGSTVSLSIFALALAALIRRRRSA